MNKAELSGRARELQKNINKAANSPVLKMAGAGELLSDIAALVVDMAARVDAVTPFLDEGGGDNTLILRHASELEILGQGGAHDGKP